MGLMPCGCLTKCLRFHTSGERKEEKRRGAHTVFALVSIWRKAGSCEDINHWTLFHKWAIWCGAGSALYISSVWKAICQSSFVLQGRVPNNSFFQFHSPPSLQLFMFHMLVSADISKVQRIKRAREYVVWHGRHSFHAFSWNWFCIHRQIKHSHSFLHSPQELSRTIKMSGVYSGPSCGKQEHSQIDFSLLLKHKAFKGDSRWGRVSLYQRILTEMHWSESRAVRPWCASSKQRDWWV